MLIVAAFFCYLLWFPYLSHVFIFTFFFTARLNGAQHLVVSMLFSLMLAMEIMMLHASAHMVFAGMLVPPIFSKLLF